MNTELENEVKQLIIDSLNLDGVEISDIETDAPLFGDGLGLDSIDALELGLAIKKKYGIQISPDSDDVKEHFKSVAALVALIEANNK